LRNKLPWTDATACSAFKNMASSVSTSVDVTYDGYLGSEIRGELLKEFVKYILYQRSQIPMYFDQIKELLHRQSGAVVHTVL
jgi:Mad1 and Cdc20-bound-Mad2 binding